MKEVDFIKIKKYFPLTIQNATVVDNETHEQKTPTGVIIASNYQSNRVNTQQFYKPISKILQF
jgi:hypothetical protein